MTCTSHASLADTPRPVVSVNGVVIPYDEIARETQNHPAVAPVKAWRAAARALVIRELLLQRGHELGLEAAPEIDDSGRRETDEEALVRAVIAHDVKVPQADEQTCRRLYDRHPDRFRAPAIVEASHILISARRDDETAYAAARGRARVVMDAYVDDPTEPGEVLIAPITDPGWLPLFVGVVAVVAEMGGELSHTMIVSRDLGIPAVVGAVGATSLIKTGDLVEVDGSNGVVRILERA